VLAIVTAVVDAGGASRITTAQATLGAYRPALAVITAISALGALTALSGLLPARRRPAAQPALAKPALALAIDTAADADAASEDCGDPICA
jgi:hypothetical protein